jgi:kynureninase
MVGLPEAGADGWQISCTQVIPMALYHASLKIFEKAGFIGPLREKSIKLTAYLHYLVSEVNTTLGFEQYKIITPSAETERGAQLSIIAQYKGKEIFHALVASNILGDWREPDVIRLSPVPLYNSFEDVFLTAERMLEISKELITSKK